MFNFLKFSKKTNNTRNCDCDFDTLNDFINLMLAASDREFEAFFAWLQYMRNTEE